MKLVYYFQKMQKKNQKIAKRQLNLDNTNKSKKVSLKNTTRQSGRKSLNNNKLNSTIKKKEEMISSDTQDESDFLSKPKGINEKVNCNFQPLVEIMANLMNLKVLLTKIMKIKLLQSGSRAIKVKNWQLKKA